MSRKNGSKPNACFAAFVYSILVVSTVIWGARGKVSSQCCSWQYKLHCVNIMNSVKMDMNCTPQLQYQQRTSNSRITEFLGFFPIIFLL